MAELSPFVDPLEDLFGQLGEFGRYQIFQHSLHVLASFFAGIHMLSLTFTGPTPEHRCHIAGVDPPKPTTNFDFKYNKDFDKIIFDESKIDNYIPKDKKDKTGKSWEKCKLKDGTKTKSCDKGEGSHVYKFDNYGPTSYVVRYDMVCDDRYKRALMRTIYLFGVLLGVIFMGPLGDKIGRKPIYCISATCTVIFSLALAFVTNYWVHLAVLLIHGVFASGGAYVAGFVLSMELVGVSKRTFCGTNFSIMFTIGTFLLVLTAYYVRNTMELQIILSCYSAIMLVNWWLCDESIRWLWGQGRKKEAVKLAQKAARWNKKEFIDRYSDIVSVTPSTATNAEAARLAEKHYGLLEMMKFPVLRTRLLLVAFNWFANSIVYYGISFNTEDLSGEPYLNFFYSGLAEVPGFIIVNLGVPYTGSRTLMAVTLGFGGLMCYVAAGMEKGFTVTIFSIVAKIGIAVSFTIVYNYTAELFPTVARNSAVGFCSMAARLAGMSTPMLALTDKFDPRIPVIVFGTVAILGAVFCAFLPETLNQEMPQTMDDGEHFQIGDTAFNACCRKRKQDKDKKDLTDAENPVEGSEAVPDNPAGDVAGPEGDIVASSQQSIATSPV